MGTMEGSEQLEEGRLVIQKGKCGFNSYLAKDNLHFGSSCLHLEVLGTTGIGYHVFFI